MTAIMPPTGATSPFAAALLVVEAGIVAPAVAVVPPAAVVVPPAAVVVPPADEGRAETVTN